MYHYGLIGNCQASALISQTGTIEWLCLPRPDSPPVFGKLLDPSGGCFSIQAAGKYNSSQSYIPNTNVLVTVFEMEDGSKFKITDFCPRFRQYERMFRPNMIVRIVEPLEGAPSIQMHCDPVSGWEKEPVSPQFGSNHLSFSIRDSSLRLATNASLTYLRNGKPFALTGPLYFGLTWEISIEEDLAAVCSRFLERTIDYWRTWVKHCTIPTLFQNEVIRSALTLKLHCFEDTGAILAALTTSLPEDLAASRNWDYRYCWLRDAYFFLSAFHNLGHFEEMESFLEFLLNIALQSEHSKESLKPVYKLDRELPVPEVEHPNWVGYGNSIPVRSFNQAAEHIQNDVYGEMILTLTPIYFDERFSHLRSKEHEHLLKHLVQIASRTIAKPDAGIWEIRDGWRVHSFSNLMSWAGIDRAARMQQLGYLKDLNLDLAQAKQRAEEAISSAVVEGSLRNGPTDQSFDASLLQLPILRFPDRSLCANTVMAIQKDLELPHKSNFLYRYRRSDDFGTPKSAFVICSFWLAQAYARINKADVGLRTLQETLAAANHLGLFSEHYIPGENRQAGNFPQAYSHVGLINAAFSLSPSWPEVL